MHTRCPHCQTIFEVNAEQLRLAHGMVCCGQCMGTFDSLVNLSEEGLGDREAPVAVLDSPPEQPRSEIDFADTAAEPYRESLAKNYPKVLPETESTRQNLPPEDLATPRTKPEEPEEPAPSTMQ